MEANYFNFTQQGTFGGTNGYYNGYVPDYDTPGNSIINTMKINN